MVALFAKRSQNAQIYQMPTLFSSSTRQLGVQLGVPFWVGPDKQLVEPSRPGAPVPAAADRLLAQMAST